MRSAIPLASTLFAAAPALAAYNLVKEYQGTNFFTGWEFYGNYDNLTNGDVTYLDQANATSAKLAYVNDAGNAIIKVDDTSAVPWNEKRNSIRVETFDYFPIGTILVFDALHLPYGCSVWPSFWTKGPAWPAGGEIDILEGVNLMTANQMAIHTSNGCTVSGTDCSQGAGCTVNEKKDGSYGEAFATAGGGVWATQFETTGVNIWFWSRKDVPDSVKSATSSIDPSSWGTPSAAYPSDSSCDINKFFTPQQLVLDISLCGDWAGLPNVYDQTCSSGTAANATSCYLENVINNGNYSSAYFEISYVKAFSSQADTFVATVSGGSTVLETQTATEVAPTGSTTGSPSSGNSGSNGNGNGTSTGNGTNGAVDVSPRVYAAVAAGALLSLFTWAMV